MMAERPLTKTSPVTMHQEVDIGLPLFPKDEQVPANPIPPHPRGEVGTISRRSPTARLLRRLQRRGSGLNFSLNHFSRQRAAVSYVGVSINAASSE
jgi:hypothetical protein